MEEAALALLVDAALPKRRILEIYLNVIEWGPGLYGLVPASRHYFGKPPAALTPEGDRLSCVPDPEPGALPPGAHGRPGGAGHGAADGEPARQAAP